MTDPKDRARLLASFGVTEDDIAALDAAGGYAEARERHASEMDWYRNVYLPHRVEQIQQQLNEEFRLVLRGAADD